MDRDHALALLGRHVTSESLTRHCIATAAVMRGLAEALDEDTDLWETIGILHDIDFEAVGEDMTRHGIEGARILRDEGLPEEVCRGVERHNHTLFGPYTEPLDLALQSADSISGFIIACALVKGGAVTDVTPKTVKKKMKDRTFAAGCARERIAAVESLMDLPDFYQVAIDAVAGHKEELGLR
ncbi:HDIG domain-containing protein [Methanofollis formosanus]|uniref:HDIG domain-containing protein n=1 Tax=Methanofollis formosanus TaxID=299308 RepID=A0A8G1EFY8_9EURY|nr:HDIG domain-containing metalloprotein [Methanofollis formosanus]QYZ78362.1 HDIG domain-containing protein [Methanofollis formosanus]